MNSSSVWDHPDVARYYEQFCHRYARYRHANRKLAAHAAVGGNLRILDFAAGTGRTAEAVLPFLGPGGVVLCVEPAGAMRSAGIGRIRDPRISWAAQIPKELQCWDRILCSAAIWQLDRLEDWFFRFASLLRPGGALCFNVPSLYLGQADEPGGGEDPLLLQLPALLNEKRTSHPSRAGVQLRTTPQIEEMLLASGLTPRRWEVRTRFSYPAYRDWLKIPVNTEGLFAGTPADYRAALIDQAYEKVDRRSWRWERWTGWTAWGK
jgi:SAM-dependent methyltransferase